MRTRYAAAVLYLLLAPPQAAFAQGAILETLDSLRGVPEPEIYRGTLPDRVDLSPRLPTVRSQFSTGTCVSWAATYAAASFALRARGVDPSIILSPSFTYNQVSHDPWCKHGTTISATLNVLRDIGALPIEDFAFDGGWCGRLPTPIELERAKQFRIKSWAAFDTSSPDGVKQQLARGVPVIFATYWTQKMGQLRGEAVLNEDDIPGEGHAMVVIGYDDAKGAFLIQNSGGMSWGNKGYGWFGYDFWKRNIHVGFVIE
jgi:C1A family cysteine protease